MIKSFAEFSVAVATLGSRINSKYEMTDADPWRLPEIAAAELEASDLEVGFEGDEILDFITGTDCEQRPDSAFSNLPLTLYRSQNLFIEALIWTNSTTTIHQHAFSGAFKVVRGSSVHTLYEFNARRKFSPELAFGTLATFGSEVLELGAVRHIWPGDKLVHSLFHLENPSITLVVRTFKLPPYMPQYSYFEPGIQIDEPGLERNQTIKMAKRLLATARSVGPGELGYAWRAICNKLSADQIVFLFLKHGSAGFFGAEFPRAMEMIRAACGDEHEIVVEALETLATKNRISTIRQVVDDANIRFLLALLMTAPNHESVRQAVLCRHPGRNADKLIARWLAELSVGKTVLTRALDELGACMKTRGGAAFQLSHDLRMALGGLTDAARVEETFAQMLGLPDVTEIDGHAGAAIKARLASIKDVAILFASKR